MMFAIRTQDKCKSLHLALKWKNAVVLEGFGI